jgi:hypothetical protein
MTLLSSVTIIPNETVTQGLHESWDWLLGPAWKPILFSAIGDVFLVLPAKTIWWLSTATGELEQVASDEAEFNRLLNTEVADEWFLPGLVEALVENGQVLKAQECYSYLIFPVFAQGDFSVENMYCLKSVEHFSVSGQIHRQIRSQPDGSKVRILIS